MAARTRSRAEEVTSTNLSAEALAKADVANDELENYEREALQSSASPRDALDVFQTRMDLTKETGVAISAVRDAMNYCLHVQQSLITSSLAKDDRSPVTIADFGAQAIICRAIQKAFPNDCILAEEHATQVMRNVEAILASTSA